mgnify:CR=1 FL=1
MFRWIRGIMACAGLLAGMAPFLRAGDGTVMPMPRVLFLSARRGRESA